MVADSHRSSRQFIIIGFLTVLAVALTYVPAIHDWIGVTIATWVVNGTNAIFALAGAIIAFRIARAHDRGETLWWFWNTLALGLLLWALGESIWLAADNVLKKELPAPSLADGAWIVGYIPLLTAFFLRYYSLRAAPTRRQFLLAGGLFVLLLLVTIIFVLRPILDEPDEDRLQHYVNILYPVGDLAIAFAALLSLLVLMGGSLSRQWLIITLGFLIVSLSDLLYTYATLEETYLYEDINLITAVIDVLYITSYVTIAYGLSIQYRSQQSD